MQNRPSGYVRPCRRSVKRSAAFERAGKSISMLRKCNDENFHPMHQCLGFCGPDRVAFPKREESICIAELAAALLSAFSKRFYSGL
jgi:hypothetical protein